jgi:hypothetical protein
MEPPNATELTRPALLSMAYTAKEACWLTRKAESRKQKAEMGGGGVSAFQAPGNQNEEGRKGQRGGVSRFRQLGK